MTSINQIIQREVNPFDQATFYTGNFWQDRQDPARTVESIHQDVIAQIEAVLDRIAKNHHTRTLLLWGDRGSGKSYLLARLKQRLNSKAFFAYIGPWAESNHIWRHTLRYTVDSLMHVPDGEQDSQLLLWLKGLSAFRDRSLMKQILGEKGLFIRNLRSTYPVGIYHAKEFFGVLYSLTYPQLYPLACDWLRGDELDDDDLKLLGVKHTINSEETAQEILANFGKISANNQPIVLCFDQLDNIPRLPNDCLDLQALFNVNSTIHTQKIQNFLVIISIVNSTWSQNFKAIKPADLDRVERPALRLKSITLDQAEALWASRLYPLHQQANPQPESPIYPLTKDALQTKISRGKTIPRYALMVGRQLFQEYKSKLVDVNLALEEIDTLAAFKLIWLKEFKTTEKKLSRIRDLSSPELIQILRKSLEALQINDIQPHLFRGSKYDSDSFSYQVPERAEKVGIVWTEDPNLTSFCHLMNTCQKVVQQNLYQILYLIRAESVGTFNNKGYKLYRQIFTGSSCRHIIPDLKSVHYLSTYYSLVNAACSGELVVGDKIPNLKELESLLRESKVLDDCPLLQELGIVACPSQMNNEEKQPSESQFEPPQITENNDQIPENNDQDPVKSFVFNLVKTQLFIGYQIILEKARNQFPEENQSQIEQRLQQLCQENKISILDPDAAPDAQLVCLVPNVHA